MSQLAAMLARASMAVIADYRGMTVAEMADLRGQLRKVQTEFHVVKNTLTARAGRQAGLPSLEDTLGGPTAIAFCYGDVQTAAKILTEYARSAKVFKIRAALLQGRLVSGDHVATVASLPPREVLIAQLLGALQGPHAGAVRVLSGPLQGFLSLLNARAQQLGAA